MSLKKSLGLMNEMISQLKLCEIERLISRGDAIQAKRKQHHPKKMRRGTYISEQGIVCTHDVKFRKHISRRTKRYVIQESFDSQKEHEVLGKTRLNPCER